MTDDIHPVDRLVLIRLEIKRLKAEEEMIREGLIKGTISPVGRIHAAIVTVTEQSKLLRPVLEHALGKDVVESLLQKIPVTTVTTVLLANNPHLTSAKK